jgi:hypothetical protein
MCYTAAMRAFLALVLVTLMFVCFTFTAIADGKLRDAAESAAAGVVLLAVSVFFARRYVFKARRHARVSDLLPRGGKGA